MECLGPQIPKLEMDFEMIYPGKSVSLFIEWPMVSSFIETRVPKHVLEYIRDALTSGNHP